MESKIIEGLISYLCLIVLITFHEFGHAWMAWRRGDDTARMLGRITLNPIAHMDLLGTVILPLMAMFLGMMGGTAGALSSFILGWGKPVPVNSANLRNRSLDWMLIAVAGPLMNILLAFIAVGVMRIGFGLNSKGIEDITLRIAFMSLMLGFFNLLPIPPLDGSHLAKYFLNIREETYMQISRFGLLLVIVAIQIHWVMETLVFATCLMLRIMFFIFRIPQ